MKTLKMIAAALLVILSLSRCDKEFFPADKLAQDESFQTIEDIESWIRSMQMGFRSSSAIGYSTDALMSDFLIPHKFFGNRGGATSLWTWDASESGYWSHAYAELVDIHSFLDKWELFTPKNEDEAKILTDGRAKAHFYRAFHYSYLLEWYCRLYEPEAPGLPIIEHVDIDYMPSRSTQAETLTFIMNDLSEAETLLSSLGEEGEGKACSKEPTVDVVKALRARLYLITGQYEEAYNEAWGLCECGTYSLAESKEELGKMWMDDLPGGEAIMQIYTNPDGGERSPLNGGNFIPKSAALLKNYELDTVVLPNDSVVTGTVEYYSPDFILTQKCVDLFAAEDYRKEIYFTTGYFWITQNWGTPGDGAFITLMNKYPESEAQAAGSPNTTHATMPFRIAEQYCIAAEAAYRMNETGKAQTAINALRTKRGLAETTATGEALLKEIQEERTRELLFEGKRVMDLRRWGLSLERSDAIEINNTKHTASIFLETSKITIAPDDHRWVFPIPEHDMQINRNLVQNPGY